VQKLARLREAALKFRAQRAKELILLRAEARGKNLELFDSPADAVAGLRGGALGGAIGFSFDLRLPVVQERISRLGHRRRLRRICGSGGFEIAGGVCHIGHDWFLCGPGIFLSRQGSGVLPAIGRRFHAPDVGRALKLDCNLEELSNGVRPLNPRDARAHVARLAALRNLQRDPGVPRQMMLGRVAAAMKVEGERRRALFEGLAEQIDAAHNHRNRFGDSFAATALRAGVVRVHGVHQIPQTHERSITFPRVGVERRKIEMEIRRYFFLLAFRSFTIVDVPPLNWLRPSSVAFACAA